MSNAHAEGNHSTLYLPPGTRELLASQAEEEAADAGKIAARGWGATGLFVSRLVYTTCYTISYGVVFSTTLLAQAIPTNNAAVRGLIDGAHAAVHQVDVMHGAALDEPAATPAPALAHA